MKHENRVTGKVKVAVGIYYKIYLYNVNITSYIIYM